MKDTLGLACDQVMSCNLILEIYAPKIVYLKAEKTAVTNAIKTRFNIDPAYNVWNEFPKGLN